MKNLIGVALFLAMVCSGAVNYGAVQTAGPMTFIVWAYTNHPFSNIGAVPIVPRSEWKDGVFVSAKTTNPVTEAFGVTVRCGDQTFTEAKPVDRKAGRFTIITVLTDGCAVDSVVVSELVPGNTSAE